MQLRRVQVRAACHRMGWKRAALFKDTSRCTPEQRSRQNFGSRDDAKLVDYRPPPRLEAPRGHIHIVPEKFKTRYAEGQDELTAYDNACSILVLEKVYVQGITFSSSLNKVNLAHEQGYAREQDRSRRIHDPATPKSSATLQRVQKPASGSESNPCEIATTTLCIAT